MYCATSMIHFHCVKHIRYILAQRCKAPDQRGANRNLLALCYHLTSNIVLDLYFFDSCFLYYYHFNFILFKRLVTRLFF